MRTELVGGPAGGHQVEVDEGAVVLWVPLAPSGRWAVHGETISARALYRRSIAGLRFDYIRTQPEPDGEPQT